MDEKDSCGGKMPPFMGLGAMVGHGVQRYIKLLI